MHRVHGFSPRLLLGPALLLALLVTTTPVKAATYFIDFDKGADTNDGTAPATAFKHSPGDSAATNKAAGTRLQAGDTVIFKGGVVYRGMITVTESGTEGKPIVFDGNTAGKFGVGKAIVDGAESLTGWKRCASADDAKNNPRWTEIFYTDVPKPRTWNAFNLCTPEAPLPFAQDPNPQDPMFQESTADYRLVKNPVEPSFPGKIYPEKGTKVIYRRPLLCVLSPLAGQSSAAIEPLRGGSFSIELDAPITATVVGIAPQPKYAALKEVAFYGDGKELIKADLERVKDKMAIQKFPLPQPATFRKLTVKVLSAYEGEKSNFAAIRRVAAYDAAGTNLLEFPIRMKLTDPANLTASTADYYDGMTLAFFGGHNFICYLPIQKYDPPTHTVFTPPFFDNIKKETYYALMNSVRLIDQPGEYSVEFTGTSKTARVFLLPPKVEGGQPADIGVSKFASGFSLKAASHVAVQGFLVRRQNVAGLAAEGPGGNIVFRDCEVTLVRGSTAVAGTRLNGILIERCHVHHNLFHTKGIVLHTCTQGVTRDCRLIKNTSTALDYYVCRDGQVIGNTVLENKGMHANGLTFYEGATNILIEGNYVAKGNISLTFGSGPVHNLIIRNNIFDGNNRNMGVGIWPGSPMTDIQFLHNTFVRCSTNQAWSVGIFANARAVNGLVIRNNIIDGLCSDYKVFKNATLNNNLYTRFGVDQKGGLLGTNEWVETDLKKIFVDPDNGDFHLKPGSPAIGAGVDVGVDTDFEGRTRPSSRKPDLGARIYTEK